jgi:hypothetical protein
MKIQLLCILAIVSLLSSCKGPEGPAGPALTGDLVGYAYLYDVNGYRSADNSGITVAVEGTSISAVSTSDGRWVLSSLTTGTYTIVFSKGGYGTRKSVGIQFVGGGQANGGSWALYQIPAYTVTGLSATRSTGYVNIAGTLAGTLPTGSRYPRLFVGTSSTVSSDPNNNIFSYSMYVSSTSTTLSASISTQYFNSYGIYAGQTVYMVAYAESYYSGAYVDLSTGGLYYPGLNPTPSNVVSVVVP